jgi:tight adherence protein B
MRERAALHRHVRALSAEGRLSAWILIALPLAIGGYLFLTDRSYLSPLFHTVLGILLLAGAGVLFVIGVFWMRAAIKVEV